MSEYSNRDVDELIRAAWSMHHTLNYRDSLRYRKDLITDDERANFARAISTFLQATDLTLDIARD